MRGVRRHPLLAAAGLAVTLTLGASQALGAGQGPEAEPGGPPACSVVAESPPLGGIGVDLWVQCNYHVDHMTVTSGNRRLTAVSKSPELVGAGSADTMACRMGRHGHAVCEGELTSFARIHIQAGVDEGICDTPRLRLSVATFGGPECTGNCSGIGFGTMAPSPTNRRTMGCIGG